MSWNAALRSSEFYVGLASVIMGFFVQSGLMHAETVAQLVPFLKIAISYVVFRLTSKTAKALIPPSGPGPVAIRPLAGILAMLAGLVLLVALWAKPAHAQESESLLYGQRFAVGVGADYDWHANADVPWLKNEVGLGAHAAYVLTSHLALSGAAVYGLENKVARVTPQLRWKIHPGGESFALGIGYDAFVGPTGAGHGEWAAAAFYGRRLWKSITVGLGFSKGLATGDLRTSAGIRVPLILGKDS